MHRVLLIENSKKWERFIVRSLEAFYEVEVRRGEILRALKSGNYDAVVLDHDGLSEDGRALLGRIKASFPATAVILTSRREDSRTIVRAIRSGAFDFLVKPFSAARIQRALSQALDERSLKNEIDYLRRQQDIVYDFNQIIAFSPSMKRVIQALKKFSETDSTLLVTGETGTGKSFLSGAIHFNSHRRHKPFIKVNCANIPETLLESELFGHEKGAFTGATKQRIGRFEQANGGTLFLDEIGEMSLALQAKMLRFLEDKSFERIGGNRTIQSDARVIVATNRDLQKLTESGQFREDLYYRINVLSVTLPPLRERTQCIEPLAHTLLDKISRNLKKKIRGFSPSVIETFRHYDWPGNIRQLSNAIERAVILEDGPLIQEESVSIPQAPRQHPAADQIKPAAASLRSKSTPKSLKDAERDMILEALEESLWIQKDAAKRLGISPRALIYKIKKFGITHPRWRKNK